MADFEFKFAPQRRWEAGVTPLTMREDFRKAYLKDAAIQSRYASVTVYETYPRVTIHAHLNEEVTVVLNPLKGKANGITTMSNEGHPSPLVEWEDCWMATAIKVAALPEGQRNVGEGICWEAMKRSPGFRAWVAECFPGYWEIVKKDFEEKPEAVMTQSPDAAERYGTGKVDPGTVEGRARMAAYARSLPAACPC